MLDHARTGRRAVVAGALTALFAPAETDPLLHLALPTGPEPDDWGSSVTALLSAFSARGLAPRLEFMEELHPGLGPALLAAGFQLASRAAAMATTLPPSLPPAALPGEVRAVELAAVGDATLADYLLQQARAFGMPASSGLAFLQRLRSGLAAGTVRGLALFEEDRLVGGAALQLGAGSAELAGVWTSPERRRRGLALATCGRLLAAGADAGLTSAWLSAAASAARLYRRLGFRRVGSQVDYAFPA